MLRKRILYGLVLILLPVTALSQSDKNIISVRCGLSSEGLTVFKLDYHYMFNKCIGIGGGLFINSEFGQVTLPNGTIPSSGGSISWKSETKLAKMGCSISAIGQIELLKIKENKMFIELEPSWLLTIPFESQTIERKNVRSYETSTATVKANGGQWKAWLLRTGLSYQFCNRAAFALSYNITNLDSYSTTRLLEYGGTKFDKFYGEKKSVVHSFDIGMRFFF